MALKTHGHPFLSQHAALSSHRVGMQALWGSRSCTLVGGRVLPLGAWPPGSGLALSFGWSFFASDWRLPQGRPPQPALSPSPGSAGLLAGPSPGTFRSTQSCSGDSGTTTSAKGHQRHTERPSSKPAVRPQDRGWALQRQMALAASGWTCLQGGERKSGRHSLAAPLGALWRPTPHVAGMPGARTPRLSLACVVRAPVPPAVRHVTALCLALSFG